MMMRMTHIISLTVGYSVLVLIVKEGPSNGMDDCPLMMLVRLVWLWLDLAVS